MRDIAVYWFLYWYARIYRLVVWIQFCRLNMVNSKSFVRNFFLRIKVNSNSNWCEMIVTWQRIQQSKCNLELTFSEIKVSNLYISYPLHDYNSVKRQWATTACGVCVSVVYSCTVLYSVLISSQFLHQTNPIKKHVDLFYLASSSVVSLPFRKILLVNSNEWKTAFNGME